MARLPYWLFAIVWASLRGSPSIRLQRPGLTAFDRPWRPSRKLTPDGRKPVRLLYPQQVYLAHRFLGKETLGWNLGEYVFGYGTSQAAAFEKHMSVAPYRDDAFERETRDGALNVVLDGRLRIIRIVSRVVPAKQASDLLSSP